MRRDSSDAAFYNMDCPYFSSIVHSLQSVKKPGLYATGGLHPMSLPSLSLTSTPDDIIGLPVGSNQAQVIIDLSTQALFGRGEETIVDTSVRRTWQLSPVQFTINNSQWSKQLRTLLKNVRDELGCDPTMKVTCELYKLLLYEPGGFFKVKLIREEIYNLTSLSLSVSDHFYFATIRAEISRGII